MFTLASNIFMNLVITLKHKQLGLTFVISMEIVNKCIAYINIGCINVVILRVSRSTEWFQYNTIIIIYLR